MWVKTDVQLGGPPRTGCGLCTFRYAHGLRHLVHAETGKLALAVMLAGVLGLSAGAQPPAPRPPRFEDYPAERIYNGAPAAPRIVTPMEQRYRTKIRDGVEKGWGVLRDGKEQNHPGPNFAGSMIVVEWGCGSPCLMMAMVDAVTGTVYGPPLSAAGSFTLPLLSVGWSVPSNPEIAFRRDSRLMVIKATPDYTQADHHSYRYYYVWERNQWNLVHRERLD